MDPWSKGDYSRIIREASMVVEKVPVVILPSGRVPGRVLLALPILEARRRRNRDEIAKKGSRLEGFGTSVKYRPKGDVRGHLGGPGAPPARPGGGPPPPGAPGARGPPPGPPSGPRATRAPGALVAPLWLSFGVLEGSGTLIFYIFFPEFFWQFS